MSLARFGPAAAAVVFGLVGCTSTKAVDASPPSAEGPTGAQRDGSTGPPLALAGGADPSAGATKAGVDLSRERAWIGEARAALRTSDYVTARARAAEATNALLSHPASERDDDWLSLLDSAGNVAWSAQASGEARAAWEQVLEVRSRTLPPDHPDLQKARMNLANALRVLGDLPRARSLQEQLLEVNSRTLPPDHSDLQKARGNLANTLLVQGDLPAARALQEQVLEVQSRTLPPEHSDLQATRLNLASTLRLQGDLSAARALQEQVLGVFSRTLPPDHPDLQRARLNLANTRFGLGDLPAARALYGQVLEVRTRTLPPDHPDLQLARASFASTLRMQGDLPSARALEEQVLEVRSRTLPPEHPDLQMARQNLANTLLGQGDLTAARALYEQALEVYSRTLPPEHPDLQRVRGNLAGTLCLQGDLPGARALQEQVLEVQSRTLPPDHPDLQAARLNLATTLYWQGDLPAARALGEQVVEVRSRTLPPDHPDLQKALQNLANTLRMQGDLPAARAHEEQVLEVLSRTLPPDHPDLQRARSNLAITLAGLCAVLRGGEGEEGKEWKRASERCAELATSLSRSATETARTATLSSSSREAEERCSSLQKTLSSSLSFAAGFGVFDPDPKLGREAFLLSEMTRASALASARIARFSRSDERYGVLRREIQAAGEELARLVQAGATREAFDEVIAKRDRTQRELVVLASGTGDAAGLLARPDPEALSQRLSEGDAIVAYRGYTRWENSPGEAQPQSTESLCAFVLRKGEELERIELGPILPIETAVKDWRGALGLAGGRGVGANPGPSPSAGDPLSASRHARRISALVVDPLLPSLGDARRLVLVFDDVLHAVSIDALPVSDAEARDLLTGSAAPIPELLGDRFEIEVHLTMQELLSSAPPSDGIAPPSAIAPRDAGLVVALGGVDYSAEPETGGVDRTETIGTAGGGDARTIGAPQVPSMLRGGAWGGGFAPLRGTLEEARGVAEYARSGAAQEVALLEERQASRSSVGELAPQARFLHLATHGWFAPESVRSWSDAEPLGDDGDTAVRLSAEERVKGSSPMLLCGLALAGANLPADALGRNPGLVTAEEVSGWDLSNCELAVLSACDTNVGERRAGQGVSSLQKALHMAGARTVITSLWKVPDEATKDLMLDFYRRIWVERKPKGLALWEAKKRLREAKDERGQGKYSTRDWAAWVLTGDPR